MAGSSASSGSRVLFRWHRAQARVVLQIRAERPASVPGAVHDVTRPCQAAVPFSQTSDPGPWLRLALPPPQTTREDEERPTTLRPRHAPFPGCPGRAGPAGAASLRSPPLQRRPLHWAAPNARVSVPPAPGGAGPRSCSWTGEQRAPRLGPEGAVSAGLRAAPARPRQRWFPDQARRKRPGPAAGPWGPSAGRSLPPPRRGGARRWQPVRRARARPCTPPSRLPARPPHGLRGRGSERRRPAK